MTEPSREIITAYIEEARQRKQNKERFVRARLEEDFPHLKDKIIRRGGDSFNAIDYLIDDLPSYG